MKHTKLSTMLASSFRMAMNRCSSDIVTVEIQAIPLEVPLVKSEIAFDRIAGCVDPFHTNTAVAGLEFVY